MSLETILFSRLLDCINSCSSSVSVGWDGIYWIHGGFIEVLQFLIDGIFLSSLQNEMKTCSTVLAVLIDLWLVVFGKGLHLELE